MPAVIPTLRQRIARWLLRDTAPRKGHGVRLYGGARNTRTTGGFGAGITSADAELHSSLTALRSRSRQMIRDSAHARRARDVVVNNVVGWGIGLQAQVITTRGEPAERVNASIERAFADWAQPGRCHTGGALAFADLERLAMAEVFEAGEVLLRIHRRRFGDSAVPLALEVIEGERLAGEYATPGPATDADVRMGVEVDAFGRAVAYWLREGHPGDVRHRAGLAPERLVRVPADDVIHLRIVDRWPQTRGVPWLHAVLRKLDDLNEYSQHEITAARASAAYFATIKTPEPANGLATDEESDGHQVMDIDPLTIQELRPGEELDFHTPNRPNSAFSEFVRAMQREIAAGCGVSYESLTRDYSQSNYSSSRLSLLEDRDTWRVLQRWWIQSFRERLHREWLQAAVLARQVPGVSVEEYALNPAKFQAVRWKPRGWSWVDPTREVTAYKEAIKAGITTLTDVIAQTGGGVDIEDVIATRRRELDMLDRAGIDSDCTVPEPAQPDAPADSPDEPSDAADTEGGATDRTRVVTLARTA